VVLASATPSLESFANAQSGKYQLLHLPSRHGGAALPSVHILDIKADKPKPGDYLTRPLREAIQQTLDRKEQALLYLNRRGVAPVLICATCGHRRDCPRCDATLVVHGERLTCHHCGYTEVRPDECPACNAPDMRPYGPGTQRIGAEVQKIFPDARVAVADSDVVGTTAAMADLIKRILAREIDIIVGTQMVTKGHHFPYLTTVGVVDADMGLAHGDLRAAERTFQLLTQVAGRAGREELPGHVYIQSHDPSHALFDALKKHDRDGFYTVELAARQAWHDPPYGRQVAIRLAGKNQGMVRQAAQTLAESFPKETDHTLLGPAPAVTERVNDT
jgi:primosomal protein N' (replication factor Y)